MRDETKTQPVEFYMHVLIGKDSLPAYNPENPPEMTITFSIFKSGILCYEFRYQGKDADRCFHDAAAQIARDARKDQDAQCSFFSVRDGYRAAHGLEQRVSISGEPLLRGKKTRRCTPVGKAARDFFADALHYYLTTNR
ncbi:hypothetical protein JW826_05530 [Candidatus Woesearchaeota archaeon]|nr:hypothetical protein [Candidatus Woesearchaeota archaeon]